MRALLLQAIRALDLPTRTVPTANATRATRSQVRLTSSPVTGPVFRQGKERARDDHGLEPVLWERDLLTSGLVVTLRLKKTEGLVGEVTRPEAAKARQGEAELRAPQASGMIAGAFESFPT
ncbi:hypothetical protein ACJZ2D_002403 [Fusarium nematophilum]